MSTRPRSHLLHTSIVIGVFAMSCSSIDAPEVGTTESALAVNLALAVTPNGDEETSSEAGDENDDEIEQSEAIGGCTTGGSAGWLALAIPALVGARRRRVCA